MAKKKQHFDWWAGDEADITIDLSAIADDLTGATGFWRMGSLVGTTTELEKTGASVIVSESPDKKMVISLVAADTESLPVEYKKHQAFVALSGGNPFVVAEGIIDFHEKRPAP